MRLRLVSLLVALSTLACGNPPSGVEGSAGGAAGASAGMVGGAGAAALGGAGSQGHAEPSCELYETEEDVEREIVLPKCSLAGDGTCHGSGRVSPTMAEVGRIAENLLDKPPILRCHRDFLVSRADPARSHVLAKIRATGSGAVCTDGSNGGPAMPYQDAPQLSPAEARCMEWWVYAIAE